MGSFYPNGALKGHQTLKQLAEQRGKKPGALYLVSSRGPVYCLYKCTLNRETFVGRRPHGWSISNGASSFDFSVNSNTDYVESSISGGYVFNNYWHAYAYVLHLKHSGYLVNNLIRA